MIPNTPSLRRRRAREPQPVEADSLAEYIAGMNRLLSAPRPGFRLPSFFHLLAERGRRLTVHPRPRKMAAGVANHCYANCHYKVQRSDRFCYAEGLAVTPDVPFPIWHAVVFEPATGNCYDPTIPNKRLVTEFFGLVFRPEFSRKWFAARPAGAVVCLIDNWTDRWPLLKLDESELYAILYPFPKVQQ